MSVQPNPTYLDIEDGLARVRGNEKLYRRMLQLFLLSPEFDQMEEALQGGDYARASELAHAIKGLTGNLSLALLFEQSGTLMVQCKNGAPDASLVEQFREALAESRNQVKLYCESPSA